MLNEIARDYESIIGTSKSAIESTLGDAPMVELEEINKKVRDLQKEIFTLHVI